MNDLEVRDGDEKPTIRDYYSDWFLLDGDFPDDVDRDDVEAEVVQDVLQERREYPVRCDLSLREVSQLRGERTTIIRDVEEAQGERIENALEEHDVPNVIEPWARATEKKRSKMLEVLEAIQKHSIRKYSQIDHFCAVSASTVGNYASGDEELGACMVKDPETEEYSLTPIGERALEIPWSEVAP